MEEGWEEERSVCRSYLKLGINVPTVVLYATQVKYEIIFLQFARGLALLIEEAQERKVNMGRGVKVVSNQEIHWVLMDQAFSEMIAVYSLSSQCTVAQ